MFFHMI